MKRAKLIICTSDTSSKTLEAVKLSEFSSINSTVVVCLGEAEGCANIFDLLKNVSIKDAPDPQDVKDLEKEYLLIFWSSGTTGLIKMVSKLFVLYKIKLTRRIITL